MNLLKSTGFALNPCIYAHFVTQMLGAISCLFKSSRFFSCFLAELWENMVRIYVDLIIIARKNLTVKLTGYYGQYAWLSIRYC